MKTNQSPTPLSAVDFNEQWRWAFYNWHGKFLAHPINDKPNPPTVHNCEVFFFWNGPHCIFKEAELIPRQTLVYGTMHQPKFISCQNFLKEFSFTKLNPLNGQEEPANSAYMRALDDMIAEVNANAKD